MKKTLYIFTVLFALTFANNIYSQCNPDLTCVNLICPDTIENIDTSMVGVNYVDDITMFIPTDTMGATVDSIVLTGISNLPNGITFECNPLSCSFMPGSVVCIRIQGVPDAADIGTHDLSVNVMVYTNLADGPLALDGYKLVVVANNAINNLNKIGFEVQQNIPNPFTGITKVNFTSLKSTNFEFEVYNLVGKRVHSEVINASKGENTITFDANNLPAGMYFYKIGNNDNYISKKMMIN